MNKPELRSQCGQPYYVMTKQDVENRFINSRRWTDSREKYYWHDNQLWRNTREQNLFGRGFLSVSEPVYLQWNGKPVQVVDRNTVKG